MAMKHYLDPQNKGWQGWQLLWSNTTSGDHPYNFKGICMALIVQWLLEIKLDNGQTPVQLGRHLLQADLGRHGYGGLAHSQNIYGSHAPLLNNNDAMVDRHSGGALTRQNETIVHSATAHWSQIRARVYNIHDDLVHFGAHAQGASAHLSITFSNPWGTQWLVGATSGHAIGLHSDGANHVYFFDPNYGVFVFNQAHMGTIRTFVEDIWTDYGVVQGKIADIV